MADDTSVPYRSTITVDEDSHLRGVCKLRAIAYLLSQADVELPARSDVFHGLAWLIEEAVDQVSAQPDNTDGGSR